MNTWIDFKGDRAEIRLDELFKLLWQKIWLILICTLAGAVLLGAYAGIFITPLYESSIKMYVNNRSDTSSSSSISSSDISASQNLVDTLAVILVSKPILNDVIDATGVDYTYQEVADMISAAAVNSTEVIRVTVTSDSAEASALIANAIAEIAPSQIMEIISGSSIKIVEYAEVATAKSSPSISRYAMMGGLLGLFLSCAGIMLISALQNGLSVEERIRGDFSGQTILGAIPKMGVEKKGQKGQKAAEDSTLCDKMDFAAAESYKLLRTNISFCFADNKACHVIGVTSTGRNEAKSTTAVNLAYTLAQTGNRVCLIDCDLRLPTIGKKLKIKRRPGLVNLLVGQVNGQDSLQKYSCGDVVMYVMASGDVPPNPSELLGSSRMRTVVHSLGQSFDYIVLDLPPVGVVSDPLTVADMVDGMVFVAREDFYNRRNMDESLRKLEGVGAKTLGVVVTHSTSQQKEYGKYGSKHGYGYGYGYAEAERNRQTS